MAGLIQVGRFGSVDATRGQGLELEVIAASVILGTTLLGGVGSIGGTILRPSNHRNDPQRVSHCWHFFLLVYRNYWSSHCGRCSSQ